MSDTLLAVDDLRVHFPLRRATPFASAASG